MNENLFKKLKQLDNADQYFFPQEFAHLKDDKKGQRLTFRPGLKTQSGIGGVRLNEYDPTGKNPQAEETTQYDAAKMVEALIALRQEEGYGGAILSSEFAQSKQPENKRWKRIKFGLINSTKATDCDDRTAAKRCHANMVKTFHRAGFIIEHPQKFDPATGMVGLKQWAEQLQLRKRRLFWPWLLLLIPLLLLPFIPGCENPRLMDMLLQSHSFILIIDRSGSMKEEIENVRVEMGRFLDTLISNSGFGRTYYGDIISYTDGADSALHGIQEIDDQVSQRMQNYLKTLQAGGDTVLRSAIELAAQKITEHGKPTTLFIITDANDESLGQMVTDIPAVKKQFNDIDIHVQSTTPRIINATSTVTTAVTDGEKTLKQFTDAFEGVFGRMGKEN